MEKRYLSILLDKRVGLRYGLDMIEFKLNQILRIGAVIHICLEAGMHEDTKVLGYTQLKDGDYSVRLKIVNSSFNMTRRASDLLLGIHGEIISIS